MTFNVPKGVLGMGAGGGTTGRPLMMVKTVEPDLPDRDTSGLGEKRQQARNVVGIDVR